MEGSIEGSVRERAAEGRIWPAFAWIGWRWISRNPIAAAVPILLPFFFLFFLRLIAPPEYLPLQIAGAMLFTIQNIGSWCLGDTATWRIEHHLQDLFVASPLGRVRYMVGIAFQNLIAATPALVILAVMLASVTPMTPFAWAVLLGALFIIWLLFSAIGLAISSRLRSPREIWPIGNLVFTTIGILSPLYYPITILPTEWQIAARFLPATYAALLVQWAIGARTAGPEDVLLEVILLFVSAVVGIVLALRLYQWRER